jgi:arabinan endo-1,5-alpha-L-arabinosidase
VHDGHLSLNTQEGYLAITSTRSDYNAQVGMAANGSIGAALASLGFSGTEDFAVSATFRALPTLQDIDQVGLFIGRSGSTLTRAGAIVFGGVPEPFSVHTENGADRNARFSGAGFNGAGGMRVAITREGGVWRYFINEAEWNPVSGGQKVEPAYLNGQGDLIAGVFAIHPLNNNPKRVELESFSLAVVNGPVPLTQLEAWRQHHFGSTAPDGPTADLADPDGDGKPNLLEYALGTDPWTPGSGTRIQAVNTDDSTGLTLTFNRVADPSLTYTVLATSDLEGQWTALWSSTGMANEEGTVTVTDLAGTSHETRRFLRLEVSR